jgi:predicted metalloendopeptidase
MRAPCYTECIIGMTRLVGTLIFLLCLGGCGKVEHDGLQQAAPTGAPQTGLSPSGFQTDELDRSIRPQDDFFEYVNGQWLSATDIPPQWSSYGTSHLVFERTESQVRQIVEEASSVSDPSPAQRQVGALFSSFMDEAAIDAKGFKPYSDVAEALGTAETHQDVLQLFARYLKLAINNPIVYFDESDADDPERLLIYFWQGGIGLPDREYYLSDDQQMHEIRTAYLEHATRMLELVDTPEPEQLAQRIIAVERSIAEHQWTSVQNRDRERIYRNKFNIASAREKYPGLDWKLYLDETGFLAGGLNEFVIAQDEYFLGLADLLSTISVSDWNAYMKFRLLKHLAPYLEADIVAENFHFQGTILRGQTEQRPRWKRGISLINTMIGEVLGQEYVKRHFPESYKSRVRDMVENLRTAFSQSIDNLDWMTGETKAAAQAKLAAFTPKLGYPDVWRDYSDLHLSADDLVDNIIRAADFEHQRIVGKLAEPVDRTEWGMSPQTVNAYYRPTSNEIVFPAAILQPPIFDPWADESFNYGAIGAVIGHEFSHGFDDQGRKFDGDGRLRDWWTQTDAEEYLSRSAKLVEQYNAFQPLPDINVNGQLTLGENIGDLAGVIMAHRAYHLSLDGAEAPIIDGLTGDQRFFIGYARNWRSKTRDERARELLLRDNHSPARYRVIGVLPNVPAFYAAFGVKEGDGMYLPEAERVKIW